MTKTDRVWWLSRALSLALCAILATAGSLKLHFVIILPDQGDSALSTLASVGLAIAELAAAACLGFGCMTHMCAAFAVFLGAGGLIMSLFLASKCGCLGAIALSRREHALVAAATGFMGSLILVFGHGAGARSQGRSGRSGRGAQGLVRPGPS
jgi:hypothetical protein